MAKSSDEAKRHQAGSFQWPSPGSSPIFKCDKCGQQRTTTGRKQLKRGGLAVGWLCRGCV